MNQNNINSVYNKLYKELVARNIGRFDAVGADAEEAFIKAFEYVRKYIMAKGYDFTADNARGLICSKINNLFKDARAAAFRTHGRRSVNALTILDAEPEEGEVRTVSMIDRYSYDVYMAAAGMSDEVDTSILQSLAIRQTMKAQGASQRDIDLMDRLLWSAPDRKTLAGEFKTSVSNLNRIKCEWSKRLRDSAPQIKLRYAGLLD